MKRHSLTLEIAAWTVVILSVGLALILVFGTGAWGEEPCLTLAEAQAGGQGHPRFKERGERRCWFLSDKRSRWADRVAEKEMRDAAKTETAVRRITVAPQPGNELPREVRPAPASPGRISHPVMIAERTITDERAMVEKSTIPLERIEEAFADVLPTETARATAAAVASSSGIATYLIGEPPSPTVVRTVAIEASSRFGWITVFLIVVAALAGLYTITALTLPDPRPRY